MVNEDNKFIYFDNAATTSPMDDVVFEYTIALKNNWENPSSSHIKGMEVSRIFDKTKENILKDLGFTNHELIFTSGASEANNLALKGYMEKYRNRGNHLIISSIEHPSITNAAKHLESLGFKVSYCPVNSNGKIDLEACEKLITDQTILISVMAVNNETGTIQDVNGLVNLIKKFPKVKLHVDAVQAISKINIPLDKVDMVTISLHKIGGLKSSGLLVKRKGIELVSQNDGGGQQNGLRSGTSDVPMALASRVATSHIKEKLNKLDYIKSLVEPIYKYLENNPDEFNINSTLENPYIINFSLKKKKASVVVENLSMENIMVGSHSACSSKLEVVSPILLALGNSEIEAKNSIRLSFSIDNTPAEVEEFLQKFDKIIKEIRG